MTREPILYDANGLPLWWSRTRRRDPITIGAGAALLGGGASAGAGLAAVVGASAGGLGLAALAGAGAGVAGGLALGGTFGSLALGLGLSYASALLQRRDKNASAGVNTTEIRLNTRQEVPARRRIYGSPLIGGPIFFEECVPPKYYRGVLLGDGPMGEVLEFYNSQNRVSIQPNTLQVLDAPYIGKLKISYRNGARDQAMDPIIATIASGFPYIDANWRQRGVATLVVEADYGVDFDEFQLLWGSIQRPNPLVVVQGVPIYDPSDPSQRLPDDPDDPEDYADAQATWGYERNNIASLVIADYLWWKDGGQVPLDRIRWDEIARSAEWDRGQFETASGELIARHTIDGVVTAGQVPAQILTTMLTANRGFISRSRGRFSVISSQPQKPIFTITDSMLVSGFDFRRDVPKQDRASEMSLRFIDPRQEWQTVDGPVRVREDWIEEDGQTFRDTAQLPWTSRHERAQRLQKLAQDDTTLGQTTSLSCDIRCFGLVPGDVVRRYSEVLPRCNRLYRVQEASFNYVEKTVELSLVAYDASIETNYTKADELEFELPELE